MAQDVDKKNICEQKLKLSFFKHKQWLTIVVNKNPKVKLLPMMLTHNVNKVCRQKLFTKFLQKLFTRIVVKSIFEQTFFKEFIHKLLTKNVRNSY